MLQRDAEWLALRAGKLTGSRFADLMAVTKSGPSASRRNLVAQLACERMTGTCVDGYQNAAMLRGIELENEARVAYEGRVGDLVLEEAFIAHPTLINVGVSPDGLVGSDGMVELKCPSAMAKHLDALLNAEHVREYYWQIVGQLMCSGRDWCDVVSYDPRWPPNLQLVVTRVSRDQVLTDIARLYDECVKAEAEILALVERLSNQLQEAA